MKRIITSFCAVLMSIIMLGSLSQQGFAVGSAPVAENLELKTYKNVSVGGLLSAYDPDGDVVNFEITTNPVKGEIEVSEDGSFVYTPRENKKGRDYFGYKAVDSQGNYSQEATVIIRIEKQKTDVKYSDLSGKAEEYAAVELAEQGIFVGEQIGGEYCFYPDKTVSRGEFLAMSMLVSDEPVVSAVMSMGIENENMPEWLREYACTAMLNGYDKNYDWSLGIDRSEAAAMLDSNLNTTKVSYISYEAGLSEEVAQACANLSACGIIKEGEPLFDNLTRSDAAQMIAKSLQLKENR